MHSVLHGAALDRWLRWRGDSCLGPITTMNHGHAMATYRNASVFLGLLSGTMAFAGCDRLTFDSRGAGSVESVSRTMVISTLDEHVSGRREIDLEENNDVINVFPNVSIDPEGGFIVTDAGEAQVRVYSSDGNLQAHMGRRGQGPGEFRSPRSGFRLPSGNILVIESRRVVEFDGADGAEVRTFTTDFTPVQSAAFLGDSLALVVSPIAARRLEDQLHIWNFSSNTVVHSFFVPPLSPELHAAASLSAWTSADIRADSIVAIFSVLDTAYVFTPDGRVSRSFAIPSLGFRRAGAPPATIDSDPAAPLEWLQTFDVFSGVRWLTDGSMVIQYQTMNADGDFQYRLLHVTGDGRWLREVVDSPRLLAANPARPEVYFVHPESPTPDRWLGITFSP